MPTQVESPEKLRQELMQSFTEFETNFRKRYPITWISTLVGPFVLSIAILVFLGLVYGFGYPQKILYHVFMTFFIFGRFIILTGMEAAGDLGAAAEGAKSVLYKVTMKPAELFGLVTYMDFMVALFVTFHMGIVFRLPYVGEKIAALVWDGKFIMDSQPWIKRMAFLGLVLFVMFPTSTTGSIGGSIFGRLLGMGRLFTLGGVLLGSLLGNALMYAFAKQINEILPADSMWIKIAGVVILIGLVVLMELRYQRIKKKYFSESADADDGGKSNTDAA